MKLLAGLMGGLIMFGMVGVAGATSSSSVSWNTQTTNSVTAAKPSTLGCSGNRGIGINNYGQVAGGSYTANNDWDSTHVFVGEANGWTDLGILGGLQSYGEVPGINDSWTVAGSVSIAKGSLQVFVGNANGLTDSETPGQAYGFDTSGQMTGTGIANGSGYAFEGEATHGLTDLGTLWLVYRWHL